MEVYFDYDGEVIVITGAKKSFPPKSLTVTLDGDELTVWEADGVSRVLKTNYINILNSLGNSFDNAQLCLSYLQNEFSKSGTGNFNGGHF